VSYFLIHSTVQSTYTVSLCHQWMSIDNGELTYMEKCPLSQDSVSSHRNESDFPGLRPGRHPTK